MCKISIEEYPVEYIHSCGNVAFYANYPTTAINGYPLRAEDIIYPNGVVPINGEEAICPSCGRPLLYMLSSDNLRIRRE